MSYIYGLASAALVYFVLSYLFPAEETLLSESVLDDPVFEGVEYPESRSDPEKCGIEVDAKYHGETEV